MADLLQDLGDRIKALGGDWTKYTVVGSFLLYVLGYLALRFHLTAIGIGTDLAVLMSATCLPARAFSSISSPRCRKLSLSRFPLAALAWLFVKLLPQSACAKLQPGSCNREGSPSSELFLPSSSSSPR